MASTRGRRQTAKKTQAGTGLRVIIYIRVSALMGRKGDEFHSPDVQERVIRNFLPKGAVVVAVIQDIDVSGQTFERAGLDQVRKLAEQRVADVVAVADLSRLGRKVLGSLETIGWLQQHGVAVWSAKEAIDDSPTGRFMLMVILGLAQMIGEQIGQQWSWAIAERAQKGLAHGSKAPMGYVKVKGNPLALDPELAPAVAKAFTDYADGRPISEIAQALSVARGKGTALPVVKWVLSNPAYIGQVMVNGEVAVDENGAPVAAEHPPLVDVATWEKVQRRRAVDAKKPPRNLGVPTHPFTELARCAACKHVLGRRDEYKRDRNNQVTAQIPRLMCLRIYKHYGPERCEGAGTPKVAELEEVTLAAVRDRLADLRTNPAIRVRAAERSTARVAEVAQVQQELARVRKAHSRLLVQLAGEEAGAEAAYADARAELRAQEQRLIQRLAEMQPVVEEAPPALLESALEQLLELWPDATPGERGRMLRAAGVSAVWVRKPAFVREPTAERTTVEFT